MARTNSKFEDDPLLSTREAATLLHSKENTLATWRMQGRGPVFVMIGRLVRYPQSELRRFIRENRRTVTNGSRRGERRQSAGGRDATA